MRKETASTLRERIQEQIGENAKVSAADAAGYARATADIVEWLRGLAQVNAAGGFPAAGGTLNVTALAIERGDFRKGEA